MRGSRALALPLGIVTAVLGVVLASPATAQPAPAPADVVPTEDAAEAAAGWLARQFADGERLQTPFDDVLYDDHGVTADAVLALDATGVGQDAAAAATAWLQREVAFYVGSDGNSFAGPLAKLVIVAAAQGADPTDFGGVDLLERLDGLRADSGRWSDISTYPGNPDYSNTVTQSLGIIATHRAAETGAPAEAVVYLESTQCEDGGFDIELEPATTCESEVDATAFATQALLAVGSDSADDALAYLVGAQGDDGSFVGDGTANSNSTGLAAQALRAGGEDAAADLAVAYVLSLQLGCESGTDAGALLYEPFVPDPVDPTPPSADDRAARATAQALGGVVGVSIADVSNEGATAAVPASSCAPPPTSEPTAPPTTVEPPAYGGTPPGHLPATGVQPLPYTVLGVLLVVLGAAALTVARRRRSL